MARLETIFITVSTVFVYNAFRCYCYSSLRLIATHSRAETVAVSGPHYPRVGVAESVAELIQILLSGNDVLTAGQIWFGSDKSFLEIAGIKDMDNIKDHAIGAPIVLSSRGFVHARGVTALLAPQEAEALRLALKETVAISKTAESARLFHILKRKAALRKAQPAVPKEIPQICSCNHIVTIIMHRLFVDL